MDRNVERGRKLILIIRSLSARRAWIEIRNVVILRLWAWSLSARRAWIEIPAYRKTVQGAIRRSPQGERG